MIWTPILQSAGSFVSDPPPPFLEKRPKHMFLTSKKLREAYIHQNGWIIGNSPNSLGSPPLFCGKYCEISVNMKWIFRDSGFADWFGIQDRQLQSLVNWNPTPRIGLSLVKSKLCTTAPACALLLPLTKLAKNISHASQLQNPNKIRKPVQWMMPSWNVLSYQLENYEFIYKLNLPLYANHPFFLFGFFFWGTLWKIWLLEHWNSCEKMSRRICGSYYLWWKKK